MKKIETGGSKSSAVLFTMLADMIMLPTCSKLLFLLKYSASLRKTMCVICEEFEVGNESNRFCGRVIEAVEDSTAEKLKFSSLNSVCMSEKGFSSKETLKICDSNSWGVTSCTETANELCDRITGPVSYLGMGISAATN